MKALLDTHTFLWWNLDDPQLSEVARKFISSGSNEVFLSAASAWEIAIKASRGCMVLPQPPEEYVSNRIRRHRFSPLPIELSHALEVYRLPEIHQDPFDRLLIAQSRLEKLPLLSSDAEIGRYEVEVIW